MQYVLEYVKAALLVLRGLTNIFVLLSPNVIETVVTFC